MVLIDDQYDAIVINDIESYTSVGDEESLNFDNLTGRMLNSKAPLIDLMI